MNRRNGKPIHSNKLVVSKPDDIALCTAVEDKFINLCNIHINITGIQLVIPPSLISDMLNWRRMAIRHRKGDFRHTETEKKSLRTVAEWTLVTNAKLRNQEVPNMNWRD